MIFCLSKRTLQTMLLVILYLQVHTTFGDKEKKIIDLQNDEMDVTLFRGAANNSYFPVYFNALPVKGAENVVSASHSINLRPERNVCMSKSNPTSNTLDHHKVATAAGFGDSLEILLPRHLT